MYKSETFGRIFWVDDENDFKSCPLNVDGTGDFNCEDYVSEWTDWEGVNYETLFNIHQSCVLNKNNYAGSLTINGVWLQLLFHSNLSQIGQEQVNGASILCVLIVNQSAKFITLVGQDYNALNVKN